MDLILYFLQGIVPFIVAIPAIIMVCRAVLRKNKESPTSLFDSEKFQTYLLSLLVSTLLMGYGANHLIQTRQMSNDLKDIKSEIIGQRKSLETSLGGQPLEKGEIYEAVARSISTAKERIRIVLLESRPQVPEKVLTAIADRLQSGAEYEIVVVLNPNEESGGFEQSHNRLLQILTKYKVEKRYFVYVLETDKRICFDTLIVDESDVGVAFTRSVSERDLENAIMFENRPDMAKKFADWFDRVIKPQAITFKAWDEKRKSANRDGG